MSREKQEPKVLHTQKVMQKQHMNGVSNAFWPSNVWRGVHTNRVAQQRRIIILLGIECINTLKLWHIYCQYLVATYMSLHRLVQIVCIGTIMGIAMILAVFYDWGAMLKHWLVFLLCIILCIFTTLIVMYVWLGHKSIRKQQALLLNISHSTLPNVPTVQMEQSSFSSPMSTGPSMPRTYAPTLYPFPDTPMPMPATPLIWVLETIDLSSTNVKHFLDIRPHSSMNILKDGETN